MLFRFLNLATAAALAAGSGLRTEERDLAGQPSAKFAATWRTDEVVAADCVNYGDLTDSIWQNSDYLDSVDLDVLCARPNATNATMTLTGNGAEDVVFDQAVPLGAIKIPNHQEILVTLSTQASIFTINTATSKKGGGQDQEFYGNIGATSAMAGLDVRLVAVNPDGDMTDCAPGKVTMASRYVELRNRIGGNVTYVDCIDETTCETKIADVELESSIGIALDTTAAHSFQWVCADMLSDTYDIKAMFSLTAEANDLCEGTMQNECDAIPVPDLAGARVILGSRIMTIQQVRAVKGSLELA